MALETCTICGKELSNRYAIEGRCEANDCKKPFCGLHWRRSNHRCRDHGYEEREPVRHVPPARENATGRKSQEATDRDGESMRDDANKQGTSSRARESAAATKKVMATTLERVKKLGTGAGELFRKLKKDKSPEAMMATLDQAVEANEQRREGVSAKLETLYEEILAKKKQYAAAPKARKRILEAELKSKLASYKASERELKILLENEQVLSQVRGRFDEMGAYDMAGVTEDLIDDVAFDIDERAGDADARMDAARALEKAGRRRERESDRESLFEELADFDEEETASALDEELATFGEFTPDPEPKQRETRPEPEKE